MCGSKRGRDDESEGSEEYSDDEEDFPLDPFLMHPALAAALRPQLPMNPCACCARATPAPLLVSLRDKPASAVPPPPPPLQDPNPNARTLTLTPSPTPTPTPNPYPYP